MIQISEQGNFASDNVVIYRKRDDAWQKLECHLPADSGTLKEPVTQTAKRWLAEFEAGTRKASNIGNSRFVTRFDAMVIDGKFVAEPKQ